MKVSDKMRKFSYDQYVMMASRFNKMSFIDKIKTLLNNKDIIALASDHNYWRVYVLDEEIQEVLYENDEEFEIEAEWDSNEIDALVLLLGISHIEL